MISVSLVAMALVTGIGLVSARFNLNTVLTANLQALLCHIVS